MAKVLITVVALYVITYEPVAALRGPLSFTIAGLALAMLAFSAITMHVDGFLFALALFVLVVISVVLDAFYANQNFGALTRYVTSLSGLFAFALLPLQDIRKYAAWTAVAVISTAAVAAAIYGSTIYAGTVRFTPFWTGIHSSALLVSAMTVVVWLSPCSKQFRIVWSAIGVVLVAGYGVITAILMLALFFSGKWFVDHGWRRIWLFVAGIGFIVVGIFVRDSTSQRGIQALGIEAVGSGRLGSWLTRLNEFSARDISLQILGTGPYSDFQITELWWWDAKNAHSDIVTLLMEFGALGLVAISAFSFRMYRKWPPAAQIVLLSVALGAASSNALLDRPSVGIAWGLALYMNCSSMKIADGDLLPSKVDMDVSNASDQRTNFGV